MSNLWVKYLILSHSFISDTQRYVPFFRCVYYFYMHECFVSMYYVHRIHSWGLRKSKEGLGCPLTWSYGWSWGYQHLIAFIYLTYHIGAGRWSQVLCKSNACFSLPSHLSSPFVDFVCGTEVLSHSLNRIPLLSQHCLLKDCSFPHWILLAPFLKISCPCASSSLSDSQCLRTTLHAHVDAPTMLASHSFVIQLKWQSVSLFT